MSEEPKLCPLMPGRPGFAEVRAPCLGEKCALYIKIEKDNRPNEYYRLVFSGCGLIQHLPWIGMEKKRSKRANE